MGHRTQDKEFKRRYRTGCWKCREKKTRCDERKPSCTACQKSVKPCIYGIKLLWQDEADSRGIALGRSGTNRNLKRKRGFGKDVSGGGQLQLSQSASAKTNSQLLSARPVKEWMFLHTETRDFEDDDGRTRVKDMSETISFVYSSGSPRASSPFLDSAKPFSNDGVRAYTPNTSIEQKYFQSSISISFEHLSMAYPGNVTGLPSPPSSRLPKPLSPGSFVFSATEAYLLDYFRTQLAQWCRGFGARNPYRNIILRLTFGTGSTMLLHAVLAASANQLRILNDSRYNEDVWVYRGKALKLLQMRIQDCRIQNDWSGWEDILATVLMLCFFDVSDRGTSTWRSHLDVARSLRSLPQVTSARLSIDQESLLDFFSCYFDSHEALASTAAQCGSRVTSWLTPGVNVQDMNSDAGVSHELLSLISQISDLAHEKVNIKSSSIQRSMLDKIQYRRDAIERQLHNLRQNISAKSRGSDHGHPPSQEEITSIANAKRLAALLYLHFRLDGSSPYQPHMARLTSQILELLPKIGVWSNTILWPLYIVGVMGVQSERDEDKLVVLERFEDLQQTRQLGNVKRARRIVESVWRLRDIRGSDGVGWEVVQDIVLRDGGELSLM
ncbi:uncharacterized protein LY89DRAFT_686632 [Mollisia scopiformis]|uniref:Zn(2)-C6 fungal-type domain-containing protein n=1 Tax=Mollisia scopiformis TaxID=149040 RepID=A0A194X4G7_MOLSC|nr:uncharacterized protein LY89DRAFT_686632 [Mollisia scopiformis]KUJ15078.1 hypothetical protein LY89DRAFT_686632 [Mollisia scopiformis]